MEKTLTKEERLYLQIGMQMGIKMGMDLIQKEVNNGKNLVHK